MSSFLAPAALFSAYCAAGAEDSDLAKGTHIRLFPSQRIGFPIGPIRLYKLRPEFMRLDARWYDERGNHVPVPDLDSADGVLNGWVMSVPDGMTLLGVEAEFDTPEGRIALLENSGRRIVASRSTRRQLVGAPVVNRLRLTGRGAPAVYGWMVSASAIHERILGQAHDGSVAMPVDTLAWYSGGDGDAPAWARVLDGAPRRWTRPDRPDGPFDGLDQGAEGWRVGAFREDIDAQVRAMLSDPAIPPAAAMETAVAPADPLTGAPTQWATTPIMTSLLMKAMDPGVARYLGLMTRLDELPPDSAPGHPEAVAWAAAGLFLVDAREKLTPADVREENLRNTLLDRDPRLRDLVGFAGGHGLVARFYVAMAIAAPPADLPDIPTVTLGPAEWRLNRGEDGEFFSRSFLVEDPPLAALAALARLDGTWQSVHDQLPMPPAAIPPQRRATMLLGQTRNGSARRGLVTDELIPAEGAPWNCRLALSDVFGRFGEPAQFSVPSPERPPVAPPALDYAVEPATGLPPEGAAVPGTLKVKVPIPAIADRPVGSAELGTVVIRLDADTRPLAATGTEVEVEFTLAALEPMKQRTYQLSAWFTDVEGKTSEATLRTVHVVDRRPPRIPPAGVGIIWTSRPGPSEDVELKLRFDGDPDVRYRAYIADARALGIEQNAADGSPRLRAEIAVEGASQHNLAGYARDSFRLLTATAISGDTIDFVERLPRSFETVQFVRIVPESDRGVAADFTACPVVPVAVPSDKRPPSPRVDLRPDPATRTAQILIDADGLDLQALERTEPGLFSTPPDAAALAPEFRLRRSIATVPDPLFAREVASGLLQLAGEPPRRHFVAETEDGADGGLEPYVRYWYWAEVRMPPERRLPPGFVDAVPVPGSVGPVDSRLVRNAPSEFSAASAAASVMLVPDEIPSLAAATIAATLAPQGASWTITLEISDGPRVSANAVAPPRVRIWLQLDGKALDLASDGEELLDGRLGWSKAGSAPLPTSAVLWLQPIDPVGRNGDISKLDVA
ncbi:MAG: hypothetical protein J7493_17605 [Porphyrobacter sp.]|nr:hypothetical protein [Porphyrobacter sp.]